MDKFKQAQHKHLGWGGLHCDCCNPYKNKDKQQLNQMARSNMKQELIDEVNEVFVEDDDKYWNEDVM